MHKVVRVHIPTIPFPLRTRDVVRTVEKLRKKGYLDDEVVIVAGAGQGYYVIEFHPGLGLWGWEHVAVDPVIASRNNIINARGESGYLDDLSEVVSFIEENAEVDA